MLASSLYTIIDGMFVEKYIKSLALTAINIGFPFIMILFAVDDMIGIGSSVKTSIALGEGRAKDASGIFSACLYLYCRNLCILFYCWSFVCPNSH